jgi:acyl-CoA thioester hydrolase
MMSAAGDSKRSGAPRFEMTRRVEFNETDMAGLVHFANFFRYMEVAEHEFLRSIGHVIHGGPEGRENGWPRVNANCDYRKPARFGDEIVVRVYVEEVRTRSVRYGFDFLIGEELIAAGSVTAAHVEMGEDGIRAVPIPEGLREVLVGE